MEQELVQQLTVEVSADVLHAIVDKYSEGTQPAEDARRDAFRYADSELTLAWQSSDQVPERGHELASLSQALQGANNGEWGRLQNEIESRAIYLGMIAEFDEELKPISTSLNNLAASMQA